MQSTVCFVDSAADRYGCYLLPFRNGSVHISHVLQGCISFNFFIFSKLIRLTAKKKLHTLTTKKFAHLHRKKKYMTTRFFCAQLTFFTQPYFRHTTPTLLPSNVQPEAAQKQARKLQLDVKVESQLVELVDEGCGTLWTDGCFIVLVYNANGPTFCSLF